MPGTGQTVHRYFLSEMGAQAVVSHSQVRTNPHNSGSSHRSQLGNIHALTHLDGEESPGEAQGKLEGQRDHDVCR